MYSRIIRNDKQYLIKASKKCILSNSYITTDNTLYKYIDGDIIQESNNNTCKDAICTMDICLIDNMGRRPIGDNCCACPEYNCYTRELWTKEKSEWCCKYLNLGCYINK